MVATINDMENHPDVCGIVYKLTEIKMTNNNNGIVATASNNNHGNVAWQEFARLTTKGDPMTSGRQHHWAVSIEHHMVFTGRDDDFGKVFVHQLLNYSNGEN